MSNGSKSYLGYLNKSVGECNNCSVHKKSIQAAYSALTKESELSHKAPKFKVADRVRSNSYKNIFRKGYTKN